MAVPAKVVRNTSGAPSLVARAVPPFVEARDALSVSVEHPRHDDSALPLNRSRRLALRIEERAHIGQGVSAGQDATAIGLRRADIETDDGSTEIDVAPLETQNLRLPPARQIEERRQRLQ